MSRKPLVAALTLVLSASSIAEGPPPRFTSADAVRAEWARKPPSFDPEQMEALTVAERTRLTLTLKRIGAPGGPALLPPELENPTEAAWVEKAKAARSPQERFTALHFLNRLKSKRALSALNGLIAADASAWPAHLHLENAIARARLNGCEVYPALRGFLNALAKAGKTDPVRAQAARLRLVLAGLEKEVLPPVEPGSGAPLALLDAWNAGPWERRKDSHLALLRYMTLPSGPGSAEPWRALGLARPPIRCEWREPGSGALRISYPDQVGLTQRLLDGIGEPVPAETILEVARAVCPESILVAQAELAALAKSDSPPALARLREVARSTDPRLLAAALPTLRALSPEDADALGARLLAGPDPMARGYAIEDLQSPPEDLDALLALLWKAEELDGVQALLGCLEKWKLPAEREVALLKRLYAHPSWTARLMAYRRLSEVAGDAPWPEAPLPTARERRILDEAVRLAEAGKPVRLRITFSEERSVALLLDPVVAPINVANLKLLASEGFFDGHAVPRVVPDFVIQMGSPLDTMDGGPGYTVRCENSLAWYSPGSVGMALSGKDTGGSQFFITLNATPHLTGRYTRVGEVEDPDRALPLLDGLELGALMERVEVLP